MTLITTPQVTSVTVQKAASLSLCNVFTLDNIYHSLFCIYYTMVYVIKYKMLPAFSAIANSWNKTEFKKFPFIGIGLN